MPSLEANRVLKHPGAKTNETLYESKVITFWK